MDAAQIHTAHAAKEADADLGTNASSFRRQFASKGSQLLLGASTGAWIGLLIGGLGGRIAMFVIRVTSPDAVIGRTSDDGFEIGRISSETLFLLLATAVLGTLAGTVYVVARPAIPERWRIAAWTTAGGLLGGSVILHADGVDFSLLHPRGLSVAMFIAIPVVSSAAIAVLVERRQLWWWGDRNRTIIACLGLLPTMLFFVVPLFLAGALLVVSIVATSSHVRRAVGVVGPTIVRGALVVVATWSGWNLIHDVTAIL